MDEVSSVVMGPLPGLLALSSSRAEVLVAQEPLHQQYTVENQPFARGKFASVKRCRNTKTGEEFAAKIIRKRRRGSGLTPESLHEAAALDLCRPCPHIIALEKVYDTPGETILILQLARGGELQSVLDREEIPEEHDVIRFLRQVLGGLAFLHKFDIAHLDLKPQNLLLTGAFPNCDIKLCDFGLARHIAKETDVREILGTPDYVAPEILNYEPISLATDMWSVGVLAYVLLTGCTPFGGETKQETYSNITRCELEFPSDLFRDVSPLAIEFISNLLIQDSSARLTAQQCLDHPWLKMETSVDTLPTCFLFREDSSTFSSNSTIVPDDDDDAVDVGQEDTANFSQGTEENTSASSRGSPSKSKPTAEELTLSPCSDVIPLAKQVDTKSETKLCALFEDPALAPLPSTRRGGSLPFRWRAITTRREALSDRASDLGYASDGISEISSADSSSDRSSIISLDDSPLEWAQTTMRRYSDTSLAAERLWRRTWERFLPATAGTCVSLPHRLYRQEDMSTREDKQSGSPDNDDPHRPWEKICTGSRARAMERFTVSSPVHSTLPLLVEQSPKPAQALNSLPTNRPTPVKVSEVRTRLLRGPSVAIRTPQLPMKAPLLHLDKTEIVKSRLVKFQTAGNHSKGS